MNIPKGATLYNTFNQYYYKGARPKLWVFIDDEWALSALEECNDKYLIPLAKRLPPPVVTVGGGSQIELAKVLINLSTDMRQPINPSQAAWMAAQLEELGYRKFEIVEEDV